MDDQQRPLNGPGGNPFSSYFARHTALVQPDRTTPQPTTFTPLPLPLSVTQAPAPPTTLLDSTAPRGFDHSDISTRVTMPQAVIHGFSAAGDPFYVSNRSHSMHDNGDPSRQPTPQDVPHDNGLFDTPGSGTGSQAVALRDAGQVHLSTSTPAKRSANLVQYADREVASKRLKGEAKDNFVKWCSVGPDEREAAVGAMLFCLTDTLRVLKMPRAMVTGWEAPSSVLRNMNKYAIRLLLSPSLAEYHGDGVVDTLMTIVDRKQFGLPANLRRENDEKWAVLVREARDIMTQRKSEIKKAIYASMNLDPQTGLLKTSTHSKHGAVDGKQPIYHFCNYLTTSLGSKSKINTNLMVTVELCTRVAFLRATTREFIKNPVVKEVKSDTIKNYTTRFWDFVDNALDALRKESQDEDGKENPRVMHQ
ncbi:hypothetical protein BC628DRAFT_1424308 [Trametes gibbosa]|nr:hypothetical protein BC628DRAFT_1424308 [Trametes gibbosa]